MNLVGTYGKVSSDTENVIGFLFAAVNIQTDKVTKLPKWLKLGKIRRNLLYETPADFRHVDFVYMYIRINKCLYNAYS
jgi:hypothetical protein